MIDVEKSIIIQRPVAEVFNYVSNLAHSAEWQSGLTEVRQITEQPLGIGTRYALVRTFMGRKMEANNEIAEQGTKLTSKIEMQPKGFISLAEPLISASLQRDVEASLNVLKNMLESQAVRA